MARACICCADVTILEVGAAYVLFGHNIVYTFEFIEVSTIDFCIGLFISRLKSFQLISKTRSTFEIMPLGHFDSTLKYNKIISRLTK